MSSSLPIFLWGGQGQFETFYNNMNTHALVQMVKCWDLEANKVIRHYHGHLSGVYSLSLHPTLDVLVTAGRDASARVWDMRTTAQIHVLSGHTATVADVKCQESDPQVITGSMDSTVR